MDKNLYDIYEDYVVGYDSKGRKFYFDLDDYDLVSKYRWYVHTNGYVRASIYDAATKKVNQIQLHRLVTNANSGIMIDHISGKRNDNRKCNLRDADYSTNMMNSGNSTRNTSGTRGVHYDQSSKRWISRIQVRNKRIILGAFESLEDAVQARKTAEEKYYGEFAYKQEERRDDLSRMTNQSLSAYSPGGAN